MLLRNAAWKLSGLLIGGGALFGFNIALMRALGPDRYGQWSFALGFAGIFAVLVDFGFNPLVGLEVPRNPSLGGQYLSKILKAKAVLAATGGLLAVAFILVTPSALVGWPLVLAAFVYLAFASIVETGQAFAQAYERFREGSALSAGYKTFISCAGLSALAARASLTELMSVLCAAGALGALVNIGYVFRRMAGPRAGGARALVALWRPAIPLFLQNLFILIYFKIDTVMLGMMRGTHETGVYSAAYRFFELSNLVPTALLSACTAVLSRKMAGDDWRPFWKRLLFVFGTAGVAGALVLGVFVAWLAPHLLGTSYQEARSVLQILSLTLLFFYPNYLLTTTLVLNGKARKNALIAGAAALFNIAANLYAIPRWGALGAAWTTLITEAAISAGCLWTLRVVPLSEKK